MIGLLCFSTYVCFAGIHKTHKFYIEISILQCNCSYELIRITCLCNEHPLTPHFYIEKVGFTRVYLFLLFLLQNIDCGYSLEPPH